MLQSDIFLILTELVTSILKMHIHIIPLTHVSKLYGKWLVTHTSHVANTHLMTTLVTREAHTIRILGHAAAVVITISKNAESSAVMRVCSVCSSTNVCWTTARKKNRRDMTTDTVPVCTAPAIPAANIRFLTPSIDCLYSVQQYYFTSACITVI